MFVTEEQFAVLKGRWDYWKEMGLPGCDERIKPLLLAINEHHGITTIFSCSGHTPDEYIAREQTVPSDEHMYVSFVIKEGPDAIKSLVTLTSAYNQCDSELCCAISFVLEYNQLVWWYNTEGQRAVCEDGSQYPVWSLCARYDLDEHYKLYMEILDDLLSIVTATLSK